MTASQTIAGHVMRAAIIHLESDPNVHSPIGLEWQGVRVVPGPPIQVEGRPLGRLYVSKARSSMRIRDGITTIPTVARRTAEGALEAVAHLMAVDRATPVSISSPMTYVGFRPRRLIRLSDLKAARVRGPHVTPVPGASGAEGLLEQIDGSLLADRFDGLALLAEAINAKTALGRYLQLIRLFERAFKLGPSGVTDPLARFLRPSPYGFRTAEVRAWTNARSLSLHADRRDEFYLDSSVRPFTDRMMQAGYEVLANKATWRSNSPERRNAWRPRWGTSGRNFDLFLTRGSPFKMSLQVLDRYKAFPMMLQGGHEQVAELLPRAAWMTGDVRGCELSILGSEHMAAEVLSTSSFEQD